LVGVPASDYPLDWDDRLGDRLCNPVPERVGGFPGEIGDSSEGAIAQSFTSKILWLTLAGIGVSSG